MNAATAAGYLAAMIDGEGTVHHVGRQQRYVVIYNTENDILDATELACQVLGIECRRKEHKNNNPPKRQCYGVYIFGRENLQKTYDAMPVDTRKRLKLAGVLDSYVPVTSATTNNRCPGSCPKCGSGCFRKGEHKVHCCENVTCGHTQSD